MLRKQARIRATSACRRTIKNACVAAALAAVLAAVGGASGLRAQGSPRVGLGGLIEAGGDAERYLRVLQVAGAIPLGPWSIQPFSAAQSRSFRPVKPHPWSDRFDRGDSAGSSVTVRLLRPKVRLIENTAFPYQDGPGPTWAGRGLTADAQAGVYVGLRWLHVQIAPVAFASQNLSFPLAANGITDERRVADARFPFSIDAPQRFGEHRYERVDPGSSAIGLEVWRLSAGFSSAPQQWGPSRDYPLVLGPSAGGFPNAYIGTSEPLNLGVLGLHGRVMYGQLRESAFAPPGDGDRRRSGSGTAIVVMPHFLPGLETGLSRFIHRPWASPTLATFLRPFSGIISTNGSGLNDVFENQNASIFARWVLPAAKAEFYAEMYKEDYPGRFHAAASSLVERPDDYSAFTVGFQRVFVSGGDRLRVVHGEVVNAETSHQERGQRGFGTPLPPYVHSPEIQGHTLNGRILGSPEAYGGAAWRIGIDEYTPTGRRTLAFERSLRLDWLATFVDHSPAVHPDVLYGMRAEILRFSPAGEFGLSVIPMIDLNRNIVAHNDVFNVTIALTFRGWN